MKKFLKVILFLIVLGGLGVGSYYVYNKYFTEKKDAFKVIPSDAVFIVETNDLTKGWAAISDSKMWQHLIGNPYFKDINDMVKQVDTYLKNNKVADLLLKGKKLIVSAHMVSGNAWDMIYVVDLETASGISGGLESALGLIPGYRVEKRDYNGTEIIQLINEKDAKDIINLSVMKNLLMVSFTGSLLERAIDQKDNKHWEMNKNFKEVTSELGEKNLFKFYFNYSQLGKFTQCYLSEPNDVVDMMGKSLAYSALNINLENEKLSFEGFTNPDSIGSYIRALSKVGPGKFGSYAIMSDQTAFLLSMGFDKYNDFYSNLIAEYSKGNTQDMEDMNKDIKLVEKLLSISIQDDLFSWFGNEIAFAKLRPRANTRMEDVIVAIHASDIEGAKNGLGRITNQIRKRSPLKFEIINYRNFEINFLEQKGFFKIFFGKLFDKLEKPFFTYIEDYVVLSNSLEALRTIIDDYVTGKTLSHNKKFMDFRDNFETKSNVALFVQMPKIYSNLYFFAAPESKKGVQENKDLILSFALVGFQMVTKGNMFKTHLYANYDETALSDDELEKFESEVSDDLFVKELDSLGYSPKLPVNTQLSNGPYKETFPDAATIKMEGTIKSNLPEGLWRTFFESGNIKSSITYKEGKAVGMAYFYFDDAKGTKRAEIKFKDGLIVENYFEYYENGAQKAKIKFEDGKMEGDAQFFYENGKLKIEAEYKKGEKSGKWKYYDENGILFSKEKWKKGKKK